MRKVILGGRGIVVDPANAIGKGGEADVFALRDGRALKLFKTPDHPDLAGQPAMQHLARLRIAEQQLKLRQFPSGLPGAVIAPLELALDPATGAVAGYAMQLVAGAEVAYRFGERAYRDRRRIAAPDLVRLFESLATSVHTLHRCGVVIGDFNDLNVLVASGARGLDAHLIDADSMQFGAWPCRGYTERFLDPRLADAGAARPALVRPYDAEADWFAFTVMLFRTLLLMDPFGGIHRPADAAQRVPLGARSLRRLSVLRPDVQLPMAAHRIDMLPDVALEAFRRVLEDDERSCVALDALRAARWSTCGGCGLEHARVACPACHVAPPAPAVVATEVVRGEVTARRIVAARGANARIVAAAVDGSRLRWLVREGLSLKREDGGEAVLPSSLRELVTSDDGGRNTSTPWVAVDGDAVVVATRDTVHRVSRSGDVATWSADAFAEGGPTRVAIGGGSLCWQENGQLFRRGLLGAEPIGDVLAGQTRIWANGNLGFGVSRAGPLSIAFVFTPSTTGINDAVALPRVRGRVVEERVAIGDDRVWHVVRESVGGRLVTRCTVVDARGGVLATREVDDESWLATARALVASGRWLFAVTDDGVVRAGVVNGQVDAVARYPDTAPFVADPCQLLVGTDGLYVVSAREIVRLTMRGG